MAIFVDTVFKDFHESPLCDWAGPVLGPGTLGLFHEARSDVVDVLLWWSISAYRYLFIVERTG